MLIRKLAIYSGRKFSITHSSDDGSRVVKAMRFPSGCIVARAPSASRKPVGRQHEVSKEFPVSQFPHLVVCPKMRKAAPGVQTVRRVVPGR